MWLQGVFVQLQPRSVSVKHQHRPVAPRNSGNSQQQTLELSHQLSTWSNFDTKPTTSQSECMTNPCTGLVLIEDEQANDVAEVAFEDADPPPVQPTIPDANRTFAHSARLTKAPKRYDMEKL
ncbi:hypothetical protein PoB_006988300 [Plakobranchus ocellatus]|uniref:Uncharacterized protein n=1 Tax=Plakobranchus ocellatus TaxID=259542 RepID=A0AAV4DGN3_9GAST|nr:hypothetical protein PoB_006988300 [Plakobranchus ocellatus]